jgi:hypothetical protein
MVARPALYEASLNRGREIMSKNWQDSTNQARNSAWQGLETFSQQQLGKPAVMCNPNDVVVYLESTYIKQHGRQRAADGSCCHSWRSWRSWKSWRSRRSWRSCRFSM